ncbi:MAG: FAD-dependent thymidylate synthase [Muribaculaceae bacterium]|nr:FAD-dependent thymidylate synthase [Roseburia sp.]MCM1430022.1 FAD-dependent thymidylate synthase [Muribaculaceae bacterium]MCM1492951.1 FAD-dependent thymidylate synthase [Muribaculaceae bacterium]
MGRIIVQRETTADPVSLIGREAGVCWGADITDAQKNYKRGIDCLVSGHGRTWEYPQVYLILDGYSARVIRELYTHIGGSPTRLQASTRYIDYESGFGYIVPPKIRENDEAKDIYEGAMQEILAAMQKLEKLDIPREDTGMLLPLGMESKVVLRTNLRNLVDMSHQRLCTRAYWEYRELMQDMSKALCGYSDEWKYLVEHYFVAKCEAVGFCTEKKSCGRRPKKES